MQFVPHQLKPVLKISLAINLLMVVGILYIAVNGKYHVKQFFFKNVIEVRHQQKLSMFRACPETKGAIIFLGNSIIEGGNWNELFPEKSILNRGIGGDVTAGVLARLDEIVRHEPSKLFICIGTNDIAKGLDIPTIIANYKSIIETVRQQSPVTEIYVQSVLPVGKKVFTGHDNEKNLLLNEALQKLCTKQNIIYIDIHAEMIDTNGYLNRAYTNDNLHLMGEAYLLWKNKIENHLNE